MKRTYITTLLLSLLLFLGSCSRYYYKTNAVNTPMFTDGNQAHASAGGSIGSNNGQDSYFFDGQFAYSPVNHLGLMFNYSSNSYYNDDTDNNPNVKRTFSHLLEGGVGGYFAVGNKYKLVNELYTGYGGGKINTDVNMNFHRFFVQYGIGMRSPYVDAIFNLRLSNVKFYDFDANGLSNDQLHSIKVIDDHGNRIDDRAEWYIEPSFTVRGGYKFIKVQMQMVTCQSPNIYWPYSGLRYTVGFYFSIEDLIDQIRYTQEMSAH